MLARPHKTHAREKKGEGKGIEPREENSWRASSNKREWDWCFIFYLLSLSISLPLSQICIKRKRSFLRIFFLLSSRELFSTYTRNQTYIFRRNISHQVYDSRRRAATWQPHGLARLEVAFSRFFFLSPSIYQSLPRGSLAWENYFFFLFSTLSLFQGTGKLVRAGKGFCGECFQRKESVL